MQFLAEVKKTYDVSKTVAEKMLWIYEKTLRERRKAEEEAGAAPAAEATGDEWARARKEGEHDELGERSLAMVGQLPTKDAAPEAQFSSVVPAPDAAPPPEPEASAADTPAAEAAAAPAPEALPQEAPAE